MNKALHLLSLCETNDVINIAKKLGKELLTWSDTDSKMEKLDQWLALFPLSGKAPRGKKREFSDLKILKDGVQTWKNFKIISQPIGATFSHWNPATIDTIVDTFLSKGKKKIEEIVINKVAFKNESSMSEERFKKSAEMIAKVLKRFKGFHKKSLDGKVIVIFKPAKIMKAKATYKNELDELWIKESPKVTGLLGKELYGWLIYIIVHELGHRYEKLHNHPNGYNREEFITTPYSTTENIFAGGEDFAEIFALSFFGKGIHPDYDRWKDKIERFMKLF